MELRNRAITILSAAAQKLKSGPIALLTMKMAADPFAKVKGLIQKLIERLLSEAAAEATHKAPERARSEGSDEPRISAHHHLADRDASRFGLQEVSVSRCKYFDSV